LTMHALLHRGVLRAHHGPGLDPFGLALDRDLGVASLDAQHASAFGGECHPDASSSRRSLESIDLARSQGTQPTRGEVRCATSSVMAVAAMSTTSATAIRCPASRLRLVTPASSIPQGITFAAQERSFAQFSAK